MNLKTNTTLLVSLSAFILFSVNANNIQEKSLDIIKVTKTIQHNEEHIHQWADTLTAKKQIKLNKLKKLKKQSDLLRKTLNQLKVAQSNTHTKRSDNNDELVHIENSRFIHPNFRAIQTTNSKIIKSKIVRIINSKIYKKILSGAQYLSGTQYLETKFVNIETDIDNTFFVFPEMETNEFDKQKHIVETRTNIAKQKNKNVSSSIKQIGYWQTVHSIESKQGKLLYRPRNKSRNCTYTSGPCGHHQLTVQALKDIGCNTKQCRKDRLNYKQSLKLSKKLLVLNEKRLKKNGIFKLEDYQKYLIHQQGAYGIKSIIAATKGKKVLTKSIKKNMANNSPYSYKQLKNMGSKNAANKFLRHWENKWIKEKHLIVASQETKLTDNQTNADLIPTFDENELLLAFNVRF